MSIRYINIGSETVGVSCEYFNTIVVGTGAAGYNAAHTLAVLGTRSVAIVTEGVNMGTSRNTGSDKQTYFKLSADAFTRDCAADTAKALMRGGCMHGDLALIEAAYANRCFYKLVALGVPFPHDAYGAYTGYKTDHDPVGGRATSCGPLTSKYMTEALQKACEKESIPVFDGCRVIEILTDNGCAAGVLAICEGDGHNRFGLRAFLAENVVWASGGPGGIYGDTVYPESQTCALGTAMAAGARAVNLTEWQYGIASLKFRWNLSGSYQQVLPRYVSIDENGVEREFLNDYFPDAEKLSAEVFSKGYEWPFDPSKIFYGGIRGSSSIDLAVYSERCGGRRVFLDFTRNPTLCTDMSQAASVAREYLKKSGATGDSPVKRLRQMNEGAYRLYLENGIDLEKDPLEISVCAQHCNGGLEGDIHYESPTLRRFFPVGEVNGLFGIKRPGGSALNSTQVSSTVAAEKINACYFPNNERSLTVSKATVEILELLDGSGCDAAEIKAMISETADDMSRSCSFLRSRDAIKAALERVRGRLSASKNITVTSVAALRELFIYRDIQLTQIAVMTAVLDHIENGGGSRGSSVVTECCAKQLLEVQNDVETDESHGEIIRTVQLNADGETMCGALRVRPMPEYESWFEKVLAEYSDKSVFFR